MRSQPMERPSGSTARKSRRRTRLALGNWRRRHRYDACRWEYLTTDWAASGRRGGQAGLARRADAAGRPDVKSIVEAPRDTRQAEGSGS